MKYIVIYDGGAEGCDYTLGCNIDYEERESESFDVLIEEITEEQKSEGFCATTDFGLDKIQIYEVPNKKVLDIGKISKRELKEQEDAETKEEELEKLRELKEKYEGKS